MWGNSSNWMPALSQRLKKADNVLIHQRQVFQVQNDVATARFCAEHGFHLAYVFCAHSALRLKTVSPFAALLILSIHSLLSFWLDEV